MNQIFAFLFSFIALFQLFTVPACANFYPTYTAAEIASVIARNPTLTNERFNSMIQTLYFPNGNWSQLQTLALNRWTNGVCWRVSSYQNYCGYDHVIGYLALAFLNETTIPPVPPGDTIRNVRVILDSIVTVPNVPDYYQIDYHADFFHIWNASKNDYEVQVRIPIRQIQGFEGNSSYKLIKIYNKEDPVLSKIIFENGQTILPEQICGLIQFVSCYEGSGFSRFPSYPDCVAYYYSKWPFNGQIKPKCPDVFISDTFPCNVLHAVSTQPAPQFMLNNESMASLHCDHIVPDELIVHPGVVSPCRDHCLESCAACINSTVSQCEIIEAGAAGTDYEYQCNCKPSHSYTTKFETTCALKTCTTVDDCPSRSNNDHRIGCRSGVCKCEESYVWDTSFKAQKNGRVCVCPPGFEEITVSITVDDPKYPDGLNVKRCVPIGRCQTDSDCDADNTICQPATETDRFTDFGMGLCVCAGGYGYGGGSTDCRPIS